MNISAPFPCFFLGALAAGFARARGHPRGHDHAAQVALRHGRQPNATRSSQKAECWLRTLPSPSSIWRARFPGPPSPHRADGTKGSHLRSAAPAGPSGHARRISRISTTPTTIFFPIRRPSGSDLGRYRSDERPIPSEVFDVAGLVTTAVRHSRAHAGADLGGRHPLFRPERHQWTLPG